MSEQLLFLQRTEDWMPVPHGGSQYPVTLISGEPIPYSGLHGLKHACGAHSCTLAHMHIK